MADSEFKKICGLWLSDVKPDKQRYMSGTLRKEDVAEILSCSNESPDGSVKIFVNKNSKRPDRKDPDYRISCVPGKPRDVAPAQPVDDSDIPF